MENNSLDPDGLRDRAGGLRRQARGSGSIIDERLLTQSLEELETSVEELRVAEEELRVQNEHLQAMRDSLEIQAERYQDLFDNAPDAYLVTDAQGIIQEANLAADVLLNPGKRSLVGKSLQRFVAGGDQARFRTEILQTAPQESVAEQFLRLKTREGEIVAALMVTKTRGAGKEQDVSLRWLFRDATAASQAEHERYRLLVQELKDYAVIQMDANGGILTWNAGAEGCFGYAPDEIIGQNIAVLFTPEDRALGADVQERMTAAQTGRAEDERWHLKRDGSRFWGSGVLTPFSDGRSQTRFVKIVRDLTERKQAEDRMQRDYVREHRIALTLQNALLPQFQEDAFPRFAVGAFYEPAWDEALVGGDFYDIVQLHDSKIAFVVGDVAGKGLNAAARTGSMKAALRAFLREDPDPASALVRLNAVVCDSGLLDGVEEHLNAVLALAVVDARTGDARIASAGLEAPILVHASGEMEALPVRGLTLGVTRDISYEVLTQHLAPDDLLILTTDGLTEARRAGAFLGHDGLMRIIGQALPLQSPRAIGQAVLAAVRQYVNDGQTQGGLRDDACLLLARRRAFSPTDAPVDGRDEGGQR